MRKSFQILVVGVTLLGGSVFTSQAAQAAAPGLHCVASAYQPGDQALQAPATLRCFDTLAASVQAATGGRVQLPAEAQTLSQAQLDSGSQTKMSTASTESASLAAASTVIGIEYADYNYGGATLVYSAAGDCSGGQVWQIADLTGGSWNDRIGSARTYGGCQGRHFETQNFKNASVLCQCSSMGSVNDKTSSIRWSASGF